MRDTNIVQNSQTLQGYIYRILQHFATEFCLLFLAVMKDFVHSALLKRFVYCCFQHVYLPFEDKFCVLKIRLMAENLS